MLNFLRHIKYSSKRFISKQLTNWAERTVFNETKGLVLSGPFKGMKLVNENVFGSEIPKLLGSYEKELFETLKQALLRNPKTVCNIGAAEGYYAIGCGLNSNTDRVLVFEALQSGRELISDNLKANVRELGNTEIIINGFCDEDTLWNTLNSTEIGLLLIDIEGAELDILSKRNTESLRKTEFIIESHDFCRPGCIDELQKRFLTTHDLTVINSQQRIVEDFPDQISLPKSLKLRLMDEQRPGTMQWLVGQPKNFDSTS